jgi:Zn-dependent protease/CBS domain-containing protein
MEAHIKLGRIFGVELGLHLSWFIIALLITFSLAAQFRLANRDWSEGVVWGSAVVTSLLFFAGLVAHELSHALVAKAHKLRVKRITLFALGGVTEVEQESPDAKTEFWVGIVGPITSWILGSILLLIARGAGWDPRRPPATPGIAVLSWLGYINILLGVFNMIPGFPLDGGRVLRATIWWITGDAGRATRIASWVGQVVGGLFIVLGIYRFFTGAGLGGIWLAFIGWFLVQAAGAGYLQSRAAALLQGLRARDLMSRDCIAVDSRISVQEFVDETLLRTAQRCFMVTENGSIAGLVTLHEIRKLERERWPQTELREVMQPLEKVRSITPETPALRALEMMARENVNQLPVISDHHLEGMLSRGSILQVLMARADLAGDRVTGSAQ